MFKLKLSQKTAHIRADVTAPDERELIEAFVAAHDFDGYMRSSKYTFVKGLTIQRLQVQDNLSENQTLKSQPLCIVKRYNSTYSNAQFAQQPLYMMGVFFSAARGEQIDLSRNEPITFSEMKRAIGQQDDVLEGGLTPVRGTHNWMKKPTAAYFATGKFISESMTAEQRTLLFGQPPEIS